MKKLTPPSRRLLRLLAWLPVAAGILSCDRQLLLPQDPFAVSLEQAQQVAEHLGNTNVAASTTALKTVTSHYILTADTAGQRPALYVFNYKGGGFTIIAADKHLMPVVAYSATGNYTNTDKPGGLLMWERKTAQAVADAHTAPMPPQTITREWATSLSATAFNRLGDVSKTIAAPTAPATDGGTNRALPIDDTPPPNTQVTIGPLVPVTWGQGCTYNNLCRAGSSNCDHRWTGCVMTATAQVMSYWRYPTNYNWAAMPTASGNAEVQKLMVDVRDVIPSVDDSQDKATSAHSSDVAGVGAIGQPLIPLAGLKSLRFHYSSAAYIDYDYNRVRDNLNSRQPVILDGCHSRTNRFLGAIYTYDECHAWVCDGSQESCYYGNSSGTVTGSCYLMFHMNWGWHEVGTTAGSVLYGDYNGWYSYNNWNIPGRNQNYQYANGAVLDIHP